MPSSTPSSFSSDEEEEKAAFIPHTLESQPDDKHGRSCMQTRERMLWVLLVTFLLITQGLSLSAIAAGAPRDSYEQGFETDLQPARKVVKLREETFDGGIIVNSTAGWELVLNPWQDRFVGTPTKELDAAWDRIVGSYVALDEKEASSVQGALSSENGAYYVVYASASRRTTYSSVSMLTIAYSPHVRHSLHCVNYLRKSIYHKYYPTILTESREHVPPFFMHVDHCIETLRQTVQCNMDLTPVPHIWSEEKGMFLASTMLRHTCRNFDALVEWQDEFSARRSKMDSVN